jgi:hypothetical protein
MMNTTTMQRPYVFISYPHLEEVFVKRLLQDLKAHGIQVWRDETNIAPGTPDWDAAIRDAICNAYAVILIASPKVSISKNIKGELSLARRYHPNRIYPLWIDGTEWSDCVPIDFINTQNIDMRGERYATGLNKLVPALRTEIEQSSPPPETKTPKTDDPPLRDSTKPSSQLSVLQLIRQPALSYSIRAFQIMLDDKQVGEIRNKESCTLEVQEGHHNIFLRIDWNSTPPLNFDIASGEKVTFLCKAVFLPPFIKLWK